MDGKPASRGEALIALALADLGLKPRVNFCPPAKPPKDIWPASRFEVDVVAFVESPNGVKVVGIELDGHPDGHGVAARGKDGRKSAAMRAVGFDAVVRVRFSGMKSIEPTDVVMQCSYSRFAHEPMHLSIFLAGLQRSLELQGVHIDIGRFRASSVLARADALKAPKRRTQRQAATK